MNEDLVERLSRLGAGVVSDVMDEAGFFAQVPARSLRAVAAPIRFAGFAVCLRGEARIATRTTPPAGALASFYAVDQAARPGPAPCWWWRRAASRAVRSWAVFSRAR